MGNDLGVVRVPPEGPGSGGESEITCLSDIGKDGPPGE